MIQNVSSEFTLSSVIATAKCYYTAVHYSRDRWDDFYGCVYFCARCVRSDSERFPAHVDKHPPRVCVSGWTSKWYLSGVADADGARTFGWALLSKEIGGHFADGE